MNKKNLTLTLCVLIIGTGTGCSGHRMARTPGMQEQYQAQKDAGVLVKDTSPGLAIGLSFLPLGIGAGYTNNSVLVGGTGIFLWPVSILWSPVLNWAKVKDLNYDATVRMLTGERKNKITQLDAKRTSMSAIDYNAQRKAIDDYYRPMMTLELIP
jgi:hypothetical protein